MSSEHIRRPMNAFIVWSREKRRGVSSANPRMHNSEISKLLGHGWRKLTEEERQPYVSEAQRLARLHKEKYPDYKYKPRRRKQTRDNEIPPAHQQEFSYFHGPSLYSRDRQISIARGDNQLTDISRPGFWNPAGIVWDLRSNNVCHLTQTGRSSDEAVPCSLCTCMEAAPSLYYLGPPCMPGLCGFPPETCYQVRTSEDERRRIRAREWEINR